MRKKPEKEILSKDRTSWGSREPSTASEQKALGRNALWPQKRGL